MSQHPSPYQPPMPPQISFDYYQPSAEVLAPNRQAAMLMFVVAGLTLLSAMGCVGLAAAVPSLLAQHPSMLADMSVQVPGITPEMLRIALVLFAVLVLLMGVGMIVLGVFVRRGSKAAVVMSIALMALAILYLLLSTLRSVAIPGVPPVQKAMTLCIM